MQTTTKIAYGKLGAGTALAAVVMNICDYVSNNFILAADWERVARLRNVDMSAMGVSSTASYVVIDLIYGFLVVFTYAAIRPRFGRGAGTASVAAFIVFLAQFLAISILTVSGFFSWDVVVRSQALQLVSILAGALSGAWIYSEPEDDPD